MNGEESVDINANVEDNKAIGYDCDTLCDPIGYSNGNTNYYLVKSWERIRF